jgi:acetylornithine/succinyldiaminopimelate/putrescine aminotransferase
MTDSITDIEDRYTLPTYNNIRFPMTLVRGEGSWVEDDRGERYLDLYGGHAVSVIGHSHPKWVEAISSQAATFDFYSNLVYCPIRAEAARLLVEKCYDMHQMFYCNSGAEANETALKIARKATGKPYVVALEEDFHGRTIGALSVTGFQKSRDLFPQNLGQWTKFVPLGDLDAVEALDANEIAAVIIEPIQSVVGVKMAEPSYYRGLREYCDKHGIVLIFDEVQTGNGRTGKWFVGEHWGVTPDLVTTAKGVGGGFPVGAVIANEKMSATVSPGDQATTFGGGPMAAAAIAATYRVIEEEGLVAKVAERSARVIEKLNTRVGKGVNEVRGLGYLLGISCEEPAKEIQRRFLEEHILVGTSGSADTFRLLPPLTVTDDEWGLFFAALGRIFA